MSKCIVCGGGRCGCGGQKRCSCGSSELINRRMEVIIKELNKQDLDVDILALQRYLIDNKTANNEMVLENYGRVNLNPKVSVVEEQYVNKGCEYDIEAPGSKCIFCQQPRRWKIKYAENSDCIAK